LIELEAKAEEERVAKLKAEAVLHDAIKQAEEKALASAQSAPEVVAAKRALTAFEAASRREATK
jgi:hypothetical protein